MSRKKTNCKREAIQQSRPWEYSTGPTSEEGKRVSSQNALKRGLHTAEVRSARCEAYDLLRCVQDVLCGIPDDERHHEAIVKCRVMAGKMGIPMP